MSNSAATNLLIETPAPFAVRLKQFSQRLASQLIHHRFLACLIFIVSVSIYDSYLVVLYRESILDDERNPICELLIQKDPHQLSWFLLGKFLGNLFVLGSLFALKWIGYSRFMTVTYCVAAFQMWLLVFLSFSDSLTGFLHFDDLMSPDPERFSKGISITLVHLVATLGMAGVWVVTRLRWKAIRNSVRSLRTA